MFIFPWLLVLAAQAIAAVWLTQLLGTFVGLGLFGCLIALTASIAGFLLHHSITGEITWRNHVAGLLLPWSMLAGRESLRSLLLSNVLASLTWGAVMVASFQLSWPMRPAPDSSIPASGLANAVIWTTILCRVVLIAGWVVLLSSILKRKSQRIPIQTIWQPLLIASLSIISSLVLGHFGYTWLALLAIGLPLFFVLSPVLLMLVAIGFMILTGKKIRWN